MGWHGRFRIEQGGAGFWQVGPGRLWACRMQHEWRLALEAGEDPLTDQVCAVVPWTGDGPPEDVSFRRFAFGRSSEVIWLKPRLPDRHMVFTPEGPFMLPAGESAMLYVSSPLWIEVQVGEPPCKLLEGALFRPSDTWFGPSTTEGELCYAARTAARFSLDGLPLRPHRAVSVVQLRNSSASMLSLLKLKLPVPHMSIYEGGDGNFWTEMVTLERDSDGDLAAVKLGKGPPPQSREATRLVGPRVGTGKGMLMRAFSSLLR
jgi:hypothetical protein